LGFLCACTQAQKPLSELDKAKMKSACLAELAGYAKFLVLREGSESDYGLSSPGYADMDYAINDIEKAFKYGLLTGSRNNAVVNVVGDTFSVYDGPYILATDSSQWKINCIGSVRERRLHKITQEVVISKEAMKKLGGGISMSSKTRRSIDCLECKN
jgi:hypothetical protein